MEDGRRRVLLASTAALLDVKAAVLQRRIGELQGKEHGRERRKVEKELKALESGSYWFVTDEAFVSAMKAAEPGEKEAREQAAVRAEAERASAEAAEAERARRMAAEQLERERLETVAKGGLVVRHVGYEGSVTWRSGTYEWHAGPESSTFEMTCHTTGKTEQWSEGRGDKGCAQSTPHERSLQPCPWCGVSRGVFVQGGPQPPIREAGPGGSLN